MTSLHPCLRRRNLLQSRTSQEFALQRLSWRCALNETPAFADVTVARALVAGVVMQNGPSSEGPFH